MAVRGAGADGSLARLPFPGVRVAAQPIGMQVTNLRPQNAGRQ